jgi:hypothetical protein
MTRFFIFSFLCFALQGVVSGASGYSLIEVKSKVAGGDVSVGRLPHSRPKGALTAFVVDCLSPVEITVPREVFGAKALTDYWVTTSLELPFVVKTDSAGVLKFELEEAFNRTVVVESVKSENLLINGSFEEVSGKGEPAGWQGKIINESTRSLSSGDYKDVDGIWKGRGLVARAMASGRHRRTGGKSFILKKEDYVSPVWFRNAKAIKVETRKEYLFSGYYYIDRPMYGLYSSISVGLRGEGKDETKFHVPFVNPLMCGVEDGWQKFWVRFEVPSGYDEAWIRVYASGGPAEIWWDDFSLTLAPAEIAQYYRPVLEEDKKSNYSVEEVRKIWSDRKPRQTRVEEVGGNAVLVVDGEKLPTFFYTNYVKWPENSESKRFAEEGVRVHFLPVSMGKAFATGRPMCWTGDGEFDFSSVAGDIERLLSYDPNIVVMLDVSITPWFSDWGETYPEAVWCNEEGKKVAGYKKKIHTPEKLEEGDCWAPSYVAPDFRRTVGDALDELVKYLKSIEVGKAVAGIHFMCGTDGQWFGHVGYNGFDYSPGALKTFRGWLKSEYGDVATLRKAWGDDEVTFETVEFMDHALRFSDKFFFDPQTADRRIIDNNRFERTATVETMNILGRRLKKAMGRDFYVGVYHPDVFQGYGGRNYLRGILEGDGVDGVVAVSSYGGSRDAGRIGSYNGLSASYRLHKKLFISEVDYRTYASGQVKPSIDNMRAMGGAVNYEQWVGQAMRDLGAQACKGQGGWFYAMAGTSWNCPLIMDAVGKINRAMTLSTREGVADDRGQVALFCDEMMQAHSTKMDSFNAGLNNVATGYQRNAFWMSGVSFDEYHVWDITNPKLGKYKVYVFLVTTTMTQEQIAFIEKNLQRDGNVLVFVNAVAMCSDGGDFAGNIKRLSGMDVKWDAGQVDLWRTRPVGSGDGLGKGLVNNVQVNKKFPLFWVEGGEDERLGVISKTGKTGWAVKRFGDWTSVYVSMGGGLTPELIRNIVVEAGMEPVGPLGDVTFSGNGFVVIYALSDGNKTLDFDEACDVVDVMSGEKVGAGVRSLTLPMKARSCRWFRRMAAGG